MINPTLTTADFRTIPPGHQTAFGAGTVRVVNLPRGFLMFKLTAGKANAQYAIWSRYGAQWRFAVAPASRPLLLLADDAVGGAAQAVVVSAVDRLGNESERIHVYRS